MKTFIELRLRKIRFFVILQLLVVGLVGTLAFNIPQAFAFTQYRSLGSATPILRQGNTLPGGRPYAFVPSLTLKVNEGGPYRLFVLQDIYVQFPRAEINWMKNNPDDKYWMVFHVFNYNTNCARDGVTEAHDANDYPLPGSLFLNDLPNAAQSYDEKKFAGCGGQSDNVNNELRYLVYGNGKVRPIDPNRQYGISTTFVDYNYNWSGSKAWVSATFSFYRHFGWWDRQEADYGNNNGDKLCVTGVDTVVAPIDRQPVSGACP